MADPDWDVGTDDERTTAVGLYHYARSYHDSARALDAAKLRTTHPEAPVSYLYFHAIELFLKTCLRLHGHTVEELEKTYRHHIKRMRKRLTVLDFDFDDATLGVFAYMEQTNIVMRARYIQTGGYRQPTTEALEAATTSLRVTTCAAVREITGVKVRS